jgi:hypothetical protein
MRDAGISSKVVCRYLRHVLSAADKRSFQQAAAELRVWESLISRGIQEWETHGNGNHNGQIFPREMPPA